MKKFIIFIATLLILAGLEPATSSLLAQGPQDNTYGPYEAQGAPPAYQQGAPPPPPGYQQPPYQQPPYQGQGGPGQGGPSQSAPPYPDQNSTAQNGQQNSSDQPGVARASYIHGDVSSQRGDNNELVPLTVNTPLEAGDRVSTSDSGRAEIQLDWADALRLSNGATAKIATLNRQSIQVQVGRGLATYSLLNGAEANAEIDTPNASLHPTTQGEFRFLVTSDDNTQIIVRRGSADVSTPQGSTHVDAGQMITVQGTDNPQYKIDPAPGRDEWDSWNDDRDRRIENAANYKNTDRYYTGSQDMDGYGEWSEVPDYGPVWTPDEGADWAPYRDGRWVYEPYYGWTWVGAEPWGWAPYHYGRWFVYGGRWSWWPGPVYGSPGYYPVWSPAYVSFFGWGGGGFGFGIGFGGGWGRVGWLPIGPGDWYHPWYGGWGARGGVVGFRDGGWNDRNGFGPLHGAQGRQFSNVHDAFTNDRIRGGVSSMNGGDFGRSGVPRNQERVSESSFRQASMMTGRMPATPSRESFSPTGREANASAFHNMPSNSQRFFSSTHTAPNAGRSFNSGNSPSREQTPFGGNRNAAPSERSGGSNTFTPPSSANSNRSAQGTQGFGNSNRGAESLPDNRGPAGASGAQNNAGGWQRFTPPSRPSQPQNYDRGYAQPNGSSRSYQAPAQDPRGNSGNSRPTLNMRQPIVTPRGSSPYGGSYNAPRGGYSAPAPQQQRGGNAPRGGGYSAPESRGGGPRGGSSAPSGGSHGGGGGGSRGGESRSGGGGGHSSNHR